MILSFLVGNSLTRIVLAGIYRVDSRTANPVKRETSSASSATLSAKPECLMFTVKGGMEVSLDSVCAPWVLETAYRTISLSF